MEQTNQTLNNFPQKKDILKILFLKALSGQLTQRDLDNYEIKQFINKEVSV